MPKIRNIIILHRVILARILGRPLLDNEFVDHVDNNSLNNSRSNLRLASKTENMRNQKRHCNNTSGYKGVHFEKRAQRYHAYIQVNGIRKSLGYYDTADEAYAAYCEAAKRYFGEFARFE